MKYATSPFTLGLLTAAVVALTACGGGGGGSSASAPVPTSAKSITVMDGLIENALSASTATRTASATRRKFRVSRTAWAKLP